MKTISLYLLVLSLLIVISCKNVVNGTCSDFDNKTDSILALMTLEEKIGQLSLFTSEMDQTGPFIKREYEEEIKQGKVGAIFNAYGADYTRRLQEMAVNNSRLKIPLLFGYDVIHGHQTIFPVSLGEAASWDMEAIERSARIAASEASAQGLNWTFAPMCDIARDPRWGRISEGAGEDPFLGSAVARARVRGFQGDDLSSTNTIAACVKHFAAYGAALAGRDYNSVDMSERVLRECYLVPYKAAIDEGAVTVMSSFNDINGIPATMNRYILTDILRDEWHFSGFVVSDYTSVTELIQHGTVPDTAAAAAFSVNAGLDMDMQSAAFSDYLEILVQKKKVDEKTIDEAVKRILKVKYMLGLFDDPFRYCSREREEKELLSDENRAAARDIAARSMVLLKNQGSVLPLDKMIKSIAVIGPLADSKRDMIGSWSAAGDFNKAVTVVEGIRAKCPSARIIYAKGCNIDDTDQSKIKEAVAASRNTDLTILVLGEAANMTGEAASRASLDLPGIQQYMAEEVLKTGKPVVVVLMNGRPLTITRLNDYFPAIIEAWYPGTEAGNAVADVLFGDYNPSGKLPVTFPRSVGQIPIFYSEKNTGRPSDPDNKYTSKYLDESNDPLYAFGYGLSYTTFSYSNLTLNRNEIDANDTLIVRVTVKNTGKRKGEEVVQLYIHDRVASVTPPLKLLKGFVKTEIEPGEEKEIVFKLTAEDLKFYRGDMSYGCEPGRYDLLIGGNSVDLISSEFSLVLPL